MEFISAQNEGHDTIVARYKGQHVTPGRLGTNYSFDVELRITPTGTKVRVDLGSVEKATAADALAKMSDWLERASLALKVAPEGSIPLFKSRSSAPFVPSFNEQLPQEPDAEPEAP